MKTYQIQTFFIDWTYKDTINPNDILNEISFSSNIDWWPWELRINTTYKINELQYGGGEYLRVTLFDDFHKEGIQIYYWYISQIIRQIDSSREYTTLVCLWVSSLLKNILFTNWSYTKRRQKWSKTFWHISADFIHVYQKGQFERKKKYHKIIIEKIKLALMWLKAFAKGRDISSSLTENENWTYLIYETNICCICTTMLKKWQSLTQSKASSMLILYKETGEQFRLMKALFQYWIIEEKKNSKTTRRSIQQIHKTFSEINSF